MPRALEPLIRKLEREASLSEEEKAAVLALPVTIREIRADHDVVRERDRPSQCCLVLDGWLHRYKIVEDGSRQIFAFHIAGDVPDLQSLHLHVMDHSLAALVQTTVAFIPHENITALNRKFPHVADVLWRDTLIDAAIFRQWMVGMGRKQAPERIGHLLCELFVKMRAVGLTTGYTCKFPLTQTAIADALGLSTVHVNRSLMELRGRGLITLEKQKLTILKWQELQDYGQFDPLYLHMDVQPEAAEAS
jgi:CRP-like cAMP-binding protein